LIALCAFLALEFSSHSELYFEEVRMEKEREMTVVVRLVSVSSRQWSITFPAEATTAGLRQTISNQTGIPVVHIRLVYEGIHLPPLHQPFSTHFIGKDVPLHDSSDVTTGEKVTQLGIREGSIVYLLLTKTRFCCPPPPTDGT